MRLGLVGYGRMGKEVEKVAVQRGHKIGRIFEKDDSMSRSDLQEIEVLIDFSSPESVQDTLTAAAAAEVPLVEGTTGWDHREDVLREIPGLTMIFSPNFSPGVYQFGKLAREAARLYGSLEGYDVYLHEWHHAGKADSPSGTAKRLAEVVLPFLPGKERMLGDSSHGRIGRTELHVTSTRVGRVPGTHELGFDSKVDSVTLRHEAHGREGFALGAVLAAEWISGRRGIFSMEDFMEEGKESVQ